MESQRLKVAIVDISMGNLFSIKQACGQAGLDGHITSSREEIQSADAVILPGVGAFGDAMAVLRQRNLVDTLRAMALSGKPFFGICLGMQLLMQKSYEFGEHEGLGIIKGEVIRFNKPVDPKTGQNLKVPQVGWNHIYRPSNPGKDPWQDTFLEGMKDQEYMYFVHSFHVQLQDSSQALSLTKYGHIEFASSLQHGNIMACQYHPERSGVKGMEIYKNIAEMIKNKQRVMITNLK